MKIKSSASKAGRALFGLTDYWDCYHESFDWDDSEEITRPDADETVEQLCSVGLPNSEAEKCWRSGYFFETHSHHIIDRYYGGWLLSTDGRTRFELPEFARLSLGARSEIPVYHATSWDHVSAIVDEYSQKHRRPLLFRGQTSNYLLAREFPNPFFNVPGLGEVSLVPSVWRRMLGKRRESFHNFRGPSPREWSRMLNSTFDMAQINRRIDAFRVAGNEFFNMFDLEDAKDTVLSEYAGCQLDMEMVSPGLVATLATLLQHYGLDSHVLDLTSSLDIAIYFATHEFERSSSGCSYKFVGTNDRKSVLYLLRESNQEMRPYESTERVIQRLAPLRPKRQHCMVSTTSSAALNLAADFLVAVVLLEFDCTARRASHSTEELFPSTSEDTFLRALKTNPETALHLTEFAPSPHHSREV